MKSKILAEITSIEQGLTFIEKGIDALLINVMGVSVTKEFNCYTDELSIITQKAQEQGVEVLLNLDMLYHQEDLLGLRAMLKRLSKYDIIALIISDVAILELVKELELDIKCISGINTLNTNYHTMNSMNKIFNGYFISNEINISEVMNIVKNVESSLVVQVYGKQKMFYSKRQLLSAYYEHNELTPISFRAEERLVICNRGQEDNYSYIYEDDYGTYIYSKHNVYALRFMRELIENNVEYLYLNNIFCDEDEYYRVVLLHQKFLNDTTYELNKAINDLNHITSNLSESFLDTHTIFTIEDAKIIEGEKSNV